MCETLTNLIFPNYTDSSLQACHGWQVQHFDLKLAGATRMRENICQQPAGASDDLFHFSHK
jgi:hypothetical protein